MERIAFLVKKGGRGVPSSKKIALSFQRGNLYTNPKTYRFILKAAMWKSNREDAAHWQVNP